MAQPSHRILGLGVVLLLASSGLLAVSNAQAAAAQEQSETEANKALVRRWIEEGFNGRNPQVVDAIFAETVSVNGQPVGRENLKRSMSQRLAAFPDLHVTIDVIVGEGNRIGMWYTAQATHGGEFEGIPPSGRQVRWIGVDLLLIEGGRIAKATFVDDALGLMRQLGATVSPPPSGK
jgi:Predicted ester cyclase